MQELHKWDIAEEQLFLAIDLYIENKFLASSITLAGAAEEILGRLAKVSGKSTAFEETIDERLELHYSIFNAQGSRKKYKDLENEARNEMKHMGKNTSVVTDLEQEAMDLIERAIINYKKLNSNFNERFRRFELESVRRINGKG